MPCAKRDILIDVMASLAGAISLLERGSKKAASSNTMFDIMLSDYNKSLERARTYLNKTPKLKYVIIYEYEGGNGRVFFECDNPINTQARIVEVEKQIIESYASERDPVKKLFITFWKEIEYDS